MLHQQLREYTAHAHAALERELVNHIRAISSKNDYIALLNLLYGYYAALERQLEPHLSSPEFEGRRKAQWILRDIRSLSAKPVLDVCTDVPPIPSYPAAVGAMYVIEGSTLGGQIIAGMIRKQLGMETSEGLSFFLSYGDRTKEMWNKFKLHLEEEFTSAEREELISTAEQTFKKFKNWLDNNADN